MPEYKITELTELLAADAVDTDIITIVDVSGNVTHKMTVAQLKLLIVTAAAVTAAGALMDSELTSIADVKALDQSVVSGAEPVFSATNFTNIPPAGNTTEIQYNLVGVLAASSEMTWDGTTLDITGIISSNINGGELRSYQTKDTINYISLKTDTGASKSGIFRGNTNFFIYYDTTTGDSVLNATFGGAGIKFEILDNTKAQIDSQGRFGIGVTPTGQSDMNIGSTTRKGSIITLSNGQTEPNIRELNVYGGSGGDVELLTKDGNYYHAGSYRSSYVTKTANYTITTTDNKIICTGTHTQTLHTAVGNDGMEHEVKNAGTGTITMGSTSSQTIEGSAASSVTLIAGVSYKFYAYEGNWLII